MNYPLLTVFTLMLALSACATKKTEAPVSSKSDAKIAKATASAPIAATKTSSVATSIDASARPKTNLSSQANVMSFINQVSQKHNIDKAWLTNIFNHTSLKQTIVDAMDRPAERKIWGQYRPIFITEKRINDGVTFYNQYKSALDRAEHQYGVPSEIITAIIGVETSYGGNKGNWAVIDALSTLAFDYPRRSEYFTKELENFLVIVSETKQDPFSYKGSYAGAMGYPQFMPSSYLAYAVDFDGDGIRDLWNNPVDAIGSVANYLAKHNWVRGGSIALKVGVSPDNKQYLNYQLEGRLTPPKHTVATLKNAGVITNASDQGKALLMKFEVSKNPDIDEWWLGYQNFYAITRYNTSPLYALAVTQLAYEVKNRR